MAAVVPRQVSLSLTRADKPQINKFVKLFSVPNSMNFVVPLNYGSHTSRQADKQSIRSIISAVGRQGDPTAISYNSD